MTIIVFVLGRGHDEVWVVRMKKTHLTWHTHTVKNKYSYSLVPIRRHIPINKHGSRHELRICCINPDKYDTLADRGRHCELQCNEVPPTMIQYLLLLRFGQFCLFTKNMKRKTKAHQFMHFQFHRERRSFPWPLVKFIFRQFRGSYYYSAHRTWSNLKYTGVLIACETHYMLIKLACGSHFCLAVKRIWI